MNHSPAGEVEEEAVIISTEAFVDELGSQAGTSGMGMIWIRGSSSTGCLWRGGVVGS